MNEGDGGLWTRFQYALVGFAIGAFFGLLKLAQSFLQEPRPRFRWWVWVIKGSTAGAVGFLAALGAEELKLSLPLAGIFIAIAGWGGAEVLDASKDIALDALRKKLNAAAERRGAADDEADANAKS